MEDFPIFLCSGSFNVCSSTMYSSVSERIFPSRKFTILVAYSSASSGLCVTITTSRSLATSFRRSMTWILVSLSSAPVGSSARISGGSFASALAMATRCLCPPDISLGMCPARFSSPTHSNSSMARSVLFLFGILA